MGTMPIFVPPRTSDHGDAVTDPVAGSREVHMAPAQAGVENEYCPLSGTRLVLAINKMK